MTKLSLIAVATLALFSGTVQAKLGDFVLTFEQPDGSDSASDLLRGTPEFRLTSDSTISTAEARFGKGSLLIQKGARAATSGWYTQIDSRPEFAAETERLSIAAWLRLDSTEGSYTLIQRAPREEGASGALRFGIDRHHRLYLGIGGTTIRSNQFDLPSNQWFHIAVTYDAGKIVFYFNGEVMDMKETTEQSIPPVEGKGSFSCLLHAREGTYADEVAFMGDRVLTADEISAIVKDGWEVFAKKTR